MFWSQTIKIKTAFDLYFILGGGGGPKFRKKNIIACSYYQYFKLKICIYRLFLAF